MLKRMGVTLKEMDKKLGIIAESSPPSSATEEQKDRIRMLSNALSLLNNKEPIEKSELKIPLTITYKRARRWIRRLKSEIRLAQAYNKNKEEEE